MTDMRYEEEMEAFIRQAFEENYEQLRLETGMAVAPDVKETGLNQILLYWQKLREIAENVTDTEVRLSLPNCETPAGREYTIEGVVDILRAEDRTVMYDIKTHDADYVRANRELYEQQLNVYAYIWQELRQQALDSIAVIATDYPEAVKEALASGDPKHLDYALQQWDPVIEMDFDLSRVRETIAAFGETVDAIEENIFSPRLPEDLGQFLSSQTNMRFATRVCRNCDARFSCSSYRHFAWGGSRHIAETSLKQYYGDFPPDIDQELWRTAGLENSLSPQAIRADFRVS